MDRAVSVGGFVTISRLPQPVTAELTPTRIRAARVAELAATAGGHLAESDEPALTAYLQRHWPGDELAELLDHERADIVKIAAICLGLTGTMAQSPRLARALHHDDYFVVNIAERGLWNIWFRASTPECGALLADAIAAMHAERFDDCEHTLDRILLLDPHFAEACNQRAVLHYLTGRFASSLMACRRTLALNPHHFGAAAGVGHNHLQLGQYSDAEAAYRRALQIHPRMEGVRQQLRQARAGMPGHVTRATWRNPR